MKIEIRLFATLASYASHGEMDADACLSFDGPATIRDAVQRLGVPEQEIKLVFLNGVGVSLDSSLKDKDRVGIFPPIGGG
ncbi:MoaD/ThiS family protein [Desulfobacter hydrogenophilus]|uniref:MoaD/ThiS family protein n=1 Tax=Desulfobacter hydrogenophilus TaxID=2291 RepID=A0A328FIL2_9BACT|nr:MoaD/ThiS family protein [Desulfobacter hydrogenophilus]NDY71751.1 MoaD/ThiS family protein [Desulfobacter hydrogenophilus]QBH13448.1 MoaD/ThiS family protein [Desulfobacter hydrogenophilus]RAM03700.1 MoaD/ThiS family protein [Desulfobacter hydrogenophilus]